jgi:hypothetical protein
MQTSHSVARAIAHAVADLDDTFDLLPDDAQQPATIVEFGPQKGEKPAPASVNECVPLLSMALHFIDRAPCALTVDGVEQYRADATRMLEHIRPVIERAADLPLAAWAAQTFADPDVGDIVDELADGFELTAGQLPEPALYCQDGPMSMPECVPLLAVALELISRGPAALTIEAVEDYRSSAMNLLKQIRPALERESRRALASWASELLDAA